MDTGEIRYVVTTVLEEMDGPGDDGPTMVIQQPPALCSSKEDAEALIGAAAGQDGRDWAVYEVVDGRCSARSVVFKDGAAEIQPAGA